MPHTPEFHPDNDLFITASEVNAFVDRVAVLAATDTPKASELIDDFGDEHLDFMPSHVADIGPNAMLDVLARARDIPQLQSNFNAVVLRDLAQEFSWADDVAFDALADRVGAMKPERAITELSMYRDVAQTASALSAEAANHCAQGFRRVTDRLMADQQQPELVRAFARSLEQSATASIQDPARDIMHLNLLPKHGKLVTKPELQTVQQSSHELAQKISSPADGTATFLNRLSTDTVGVVDRSGTPLQVAKLSAKQTEALPSHQIESTTLAHLEAIAKTPLHQVDAIELVTVLHAGQATDSAVEALKLEHLLPTSAHHQAELSRALQITQAADQTIAHFRQQRLAQAEAAVMQATAQIGQHLLQDDKVVAHLQQFDPERWQTIQQAIDHNPDYGYELLDGLLHEVDAQTLLGDGVSQPEPPELAAISEARSSIWLSGIQLRQQASREVGAHQQAVREQPDYHRAADVLQQIGDELTDDQNWPTFQANLAQASHDALAEYAQPDFQPVAQAVPVKTSLFTAIHEQHVSDTLSQTLGFELAAISLTAQEEAIDYLLRIKGDDFAALKTQLDTAPEPNTRAKLFEAFTATEFGDDFGGIVLDVYRADGAKALPVMEHIRAVRDLSTTIGASFASDNSHDQQLAKAVPRAFIKRTTELLALARRDGVAAVEPSLRAIHTAAGHIASAVGEDSFHVVAAETDHGTLRADSQPVTITARPNGDNARLGFTVRGLGSDKRQRLNIRLDYEAGNLSLDIGSTAQQDVNSSDIARQIGNDLARGELALANYRAEQAIANGVRQQHITLNGNHVREAFADMGQLQPEEFSGIVNRFLYRLPLNDPNTTETTA